MVPLVGVFGEEGIYAQDMFDGDDEISFPSPPCIRGETARSERQVFQHHPRDIRTKRDSAPRNDGPRFFFR